MNLDEIFRGPMTPARWTALGKYMRAQSIRSGPGVRIKRIGGNTIISADGRGKSRGGAPPGGAFYTMINDPATGHIYLQGGQINGGSGNITVPNIKIYDGALEQWLGDPGEHLILEISGDGSEADGVLLPTFDVDALNTDPAANAVIPDNVIPEVGSLAGMCAVSLGVFSATDFHPAAVGNIGVSFCFSGFTVTRA